MHDVKKVKKVIQDGKLVLVKRASSAKN